MIPCKYNLPHNINQSGYAFMDISVAPFVKSAREVRTVKISQNSFS